MKKTYFISLLILIVSICNIAFAWKKEIKTKTMTYTQYNNYEEWYNPDNTDEFHVELEVVIGSIEEVEYNVSRILMWVKDDVGYYPHAQRFYRGSNKSFPGNPQVGQRIIYEIVPTTYSSIDDDQIVSWNVIEENVDTKRIAREYSKGKTTSFEDFDKILPWWKTDSRVEPVMIETVIGSVIDTVDDANTNYIYDLWIKGENGYYYVPQSGLRGYTLSIKPQYGQRIVFELTQNGFNSITYNNVQKMFVIEENVDVPAIEKEYLASDKSGILKHLVEPFSAMDYKETTYKSILRDIESFYDVPIVVEGTYLQDLKNGYGLLNCKGDIYRIYISQFSVREDIINFNLLLNDKIRIYGFIDSDLYTYSSWVGEKTVPTVIVRHIDLLDD